MDIAHIITEDRRGSHRLWPLFWIYGVAFSHVMFGAIVLLYAHLGTPVLGVVLFGFMLYTAWIMRSVWVNAFNVDNELHGHWARGLTVAWSINSVLVCGFMFLAHLAGEPLPLPF